MANQLANESSLYLNQHKENPVNWLPWSQDAFDLAKKENKPIFLSIGYSACHWCHVMAHECFEDEDVAKLMNENFINIKVDKEERPDIDQIYQTAHFIFSRRPGGWPLSVFLTPEQEPYYIGTYFPKISKYNLPGLPELIKRLSQLYKDEKDLVLNKFNDRKIDILVSTTVIEVGIDFPNANVIVIENSNKYGLSQLHQLRGRVGRGTKKSYCILVRRNITDASRNRLAVILFPINAAVIPEASIVDSFSVEHT